MNYYEIHENNSGGYYCNPYGAMYIVVKADSEQEALEILQSQDWYTEDYCECCGGRWLGSATLIKDSWLYEDDNEVISR